MKKSKYHIVMIALIAIVTICVAATSPTEKQKNNLKVLPKDISHENLEKVMKDFNKALGVKCNFCHAPSATDPQKLDFASDAKPEKLAAIDMMRLTLKINKKYFHVKNASLTDALPVSCNTCHHGVAKPE